jgi:hypothetical protein
MNMQFFIHKYRYKFLSATTGNCSTHLCHPWERFRFSPCVGSAQPRAATLGRRAPCLLPCLWTGPPHPLTPSWASRATRMCRLLDHRPQATGRTGYAGRAWAERSSSNVLRPKSGWSVTSGHGKHLSPLSFNKLRNFQCKSWLLVYLLFNYHNFSASV